MSRLFVLFCFAFCLVLLVYKRIGVMVLLYEGRGEVLR